MVWGRGFGSLVAVGILSDLTDFNTEPMQLTDSSDYPFEFNSRIETMPDAKVEMGVVFVPKKLAIRLKLAKHTRLRIEGEISGEPFEAALNPMKGRWFMMVSKRLRKRCGVEIGARVSIRFNVADQNRVDVPRELQFAIEANPEALRAWEELSPGKRRSLSHRVATAKKVETVENRVEEVLYFLTNDSSSPVNKMRRKR